MSAPRWDIAAREREVSTACDGGVAQTGSIASPSCSGHKHAEPHDLGLRSWGSARPQPGRRGVGYFLGCRSRSASAVVLGHRAKRTLRTCGRSGCVVQSAVQFSRSPICRARAISSTGSPPPYSMVMSAAWRAAARSRNSKDTRHLSVTEALDSVGGVASRPPRWMTLRCRYTRRTKFRPAGTEAEAPNGARPLRDMKVESSCAWY